MDAGSSLSLGHAGGCSVFWMRVKPVWSSLISSDLSKLRFSLVAQLVMFIGLMFSRCLLASDPYGAIAASPRWDSRPSKG